MGTELILSLIERSRITVDGLLATRHVARTYEERCRYALDLVDMHLHDEKPGADRRVPEALYRRCRVGVPGPSGIVRTCGSSQSAEGIKFRPIERFATPQRVFDDMEPRFRLAGDGFETSPSPIGTRVSMRLLHSFHIRDGMIEREIGYEVWRRDE